MLMQIWEDEEGFEGGGITCIAYHQFKQLQEQGMISPGAILIAQFEAKTWLEAMQIKNQILGYGEYKPSYLANGELDPVYLEDLDEHYAKHNK